MLVERSSVGDKAASDFEVAIESFLVGIIGSEGVNEMRTLALLHLFEDSRKGPGDFDPALKAGELGRENLFVRSVVGDAGAVVTSEF